MIRHVALVLVLAIAAPAFAKDTVELESGRVLEGKIVREEKAWVGIETTDGVVWVQRDEIKALKRDRPSPAVRRETPPAEAEEKPAVREGAGTRKGAEPAPDATESVQDEAALSAEALRLQNALGSESVEQRRAATEWILDTWPKFRDVLATVLRESPETPRNEAVRILDDARIEDPFPLLEPSLTDESKKVRITALRVARHRRLTGAETHALEMMRKDPLWVVRQEAIRTLESVGTEMCLPHVMAAWTSETDKDRRRRYRRVMAALLGEDFGDEDAAAWYRAADELFMGARELRKGKKKKKDDSD